ncbi:MAG: hypothetical protein FWD34_02525 [Oscillospiraceae bacterium]|nr:hypothetical protein [Oscillospiraceae bacterium]
MSGPTEISEIKIEEKPISVEPQQVQVQQQQDFDLMFEGYDNKNTVKNLKGELTTGGKWWSRKDSAIYLSVLASASAVESEYANKFNATEVEVNAVSQKYDALITSCQTYLAARKGKRRTKEGKHRQYKIMQLLASAQAEKDLVVSYSGNTDYTDLTLESFLVTTAQIKAIGAGFDCKSDSETYKNVMDFQSFATIVSKAPGVDEGLDKAKNVPAIATLLQAYHEFKNADVDDYAHTIKSTLMNIIVLCSTNKLPKESERSPSQKALYELFQQCSRRYADIMKKDKEYKDKYKTYKEEYDSILNDGKFKMVDTFENFLEEKGFVLRKRSKAEEDAIKKKGNLKNSTPYITKLTGDYEGIKDSIFDEYNVPNFKMAEDLGLKNIYNIAKTKEGDSREKEIGTLIYDTEIGYVKSKNYSGFNNYIRAKGRHLRANGNLDGFKIEEEQEKLIGFMDEACISDTLTEKTRLFRMVKSDYLLHAMGIKVDLNKLGEGNEEMVDQINKKAGTILQDDAYMSAGYRIDICFRDHPVMITMLCDEGTRLFRTDNYKETEVIFQRNTRYKIMGACINRNKDFEVSGKDEVRRKQFREEYTYNGIEIFIKVIQDNDDNN